MIRQAWNYLVTLLHRLGILLGLRATTKNSTKGSTPAAEPPWLIVARGERGTEEISGPEHNPKILEYHSTLKEPFTTDEISWCSSIMNWCFIQVGIKGTDSALARSWLRWGIPLDKPRPGAVMIYERGDEPWMGHVNLYTGEDSRYYFGIGGNQGNTVNITRYPKDKLLGIRWPKDA